MNVPIPRKYAKFVKQCIASGRFPSEAEVAKEAFALLAERERMRELIDEGLDDFKRGDYTTYDVDSLDSLIENIRADSKALRAKRGK